jgi:hypothetical protein
VPHLVQMQEEFGGPEFAVVGVTAADADEAREFLVEASGNYPALSEAQATLTAWGIDMIWGNVVYLVDPDGRIVADELDDAREQMEKVLAGT